MTLPGPLEPWTPRKEPAAERRVARLMAAGLAVELFGAYAMLKGNSLQSLQSILISSSIPAWGFSLIIAGGYIYGCAQSFALIRRHFWDWSELKLLAIPFSLAAALTEEIFFRKILMDALNHAGWVLGAQIAASGLTFGAAHSVWGLLGSRSASGAVSAMAWTGALGLSLGCLYAFCGRAVAPCIGAHALINLALEPWLILAVMRRNEEGRRPKPAI